jgi:hypothetical protein
VLYLNDPHAVRRILLADGWHGVHDSGLRVTDRGVSWTPALEDALDHPGLGQVVRVYAAKADVLAVEEWAPPPEPVTGLDFERRLRTAAEPPAP